MRPTDEGLQAAIAEGSRKLALLAKINLLRPQVPAAFGDGSVTPSFLVPLEEKEFEDVALEELEAALEGLQRYKDARQVKPRRLRRSR